MYVKLVLALMVLCAVISKTESEKSYDARPYMQGYTRIKRGKYNSGPPQRFFSRPPVTSLNKGVFSYTPPPNYMLDDDEPQYPGPPGSHSRPPKVSKRPYDDEQYPGPPGPYSKSPKAGKRPSNDGLGDDDINNIVKYLSKQDLDKIINLAGGGDKESSKYSKESFDKDVEYSRPLKDKFKSSNSGFDDIDSDNYSIKSIGDEDSKLFKAFVQEIDMDSNIDYNTLNKKTQPFNVETYKIPSGPATNFVTQATPPQSFFASQQYSQPYDTTALEAEESMLKKQIAYLKSQINDGVVYTDSELIPEENLPKPMNLREEQDFDVSYTNNVPTVVKAEQSNSYKLENFGELPLMSNNYKIDSQSSYHVPHYTVTSTSSISKPLSSYSSPSAYSAPSPYGPRVPSVEPAPPPSAAKAQSDAHLKAVRIWSHKSKGTAYTLHDDGSLSLEKPGRPKGRYGYP